MLCHLCLPIPADVAISAPFGQGLSGTVYIYRGSRQGIVTTPAQTLVGSELNLVPSAVSGLTSFGAYLSASTDIDGNQYNGEDMSLWYSFVKPLTYMHRPTFYVRFCLSPDLFTSFHFVFSFRSGYWGIHVSQGVCDKVSRDTSAVKFTWSAWECGWVAVPTDCLLCVC